MSRTKSRKKPRKKSVREYLTEYTPGSNILGDCFLLPEEDTARKIHIRFRGPVAATPCFKNNREGGIGLPNSVIARLRLMDTLYQEWMYTHKWERVKFKQEKCFMMCRFATRGTKRGGNFDSDNAFSTVKDWLEPPIKNKMNRGWGIGLIENDRQIRGYSENKDRDEEGADITDIYIYRYDYIEYYLNRFRCNIIDGSFPKGI